MDRYLLKLEFSTRCVVPAFLLTLLLSCFAFTSVGQNRSELQCEDGNYDCLASQHFRSVAVVCKGKGNDCWIAEYTKLIESNPLDGAAYLIRARTYWTKHPAIAIQDFNKAIELNPSYFQTYISLGIFYCAVKDYKKGIIEFNRAIHVAEQQDRHRRLLYLANAYVNRGFAHLLELDYEAALADYNRVIEMNPRSASGYAGRASVRAAQGEIEKAIADYSKAIELDPSDWPSYYVRGNLYLKQGDKLKGEEDLKKAEELKKLEGTH